MKDTHTTSIKMLTQSSRPYPGSPRTNLSTLAGPKFFPQDALQIDDDMDLNNREHTVTPPPLHTSSPTSPVTPTPLARTTHTQPLLTDLPATQETQVTAPKNTLSPIDSDLANSIHAPRENADDHQMSAPTPPTTQHLPDEEEQTILAHLALAEQNRSIVQHDGPHHSTALPQFTPTPIGGFPHTHMSHSAQAFDHVDNRVLTAWFQVDHPKFLVRIFDHSGKEVSEKAAILAERIRANISIIANFIHQGAQTIRVSPPQPQGGKDAKELPLSFLVYNTSPETKDLIISQRIWSAADITFEAHPFSCYRPPDLLFCLTGFSTPDTGVIQKTVADVWAFEDNRAQINDILSMSEIPEERVHLATWELIRNIRVERLDFKIAGGLPVPRFNILAHSPTCDAKAWTELRSFLRILEYPTGLDGCGTAVALSPCPICHSIAHPRGLCPFPSIAQWNGPKIGNKSTGQPARSAGSGRGKGRRHQT
ncbi:hypothetical protein DEU56DRAFT_755301 [Suillus clintonianus]|uniref:uncharacterized protein n=1 Tax=Suillus clintonianus TaxID=1904413 RepID=UPI001B860DBC|nr:uncharacterized protein DEU56DRAFT_755301 [Suillus clintonianus]KAG2140060.1 hypothetical protein DEU56DRAFT_755301 [Suillus clintonianus]